MPDRDAITPVRWLLLPRFVGAVLVATGTGKLLDLAGFVDVVATFRLLSATGATVVAYTLPFVELAVGICLVIGVYLRVAATLAVGLHGLLLGVVLLTLARGIPVENCGCFGVFLARPLGLQTAIEDAVMLGLSLAALYVAANRERGRRHDTERAFAREHATRSVP